MSVEVNINVFKPLKILKKRKNADYRFNQECYETLLKNQLDKNALAAEFQQGVTAQNLNAISFYNARKEKQNIALKKFEEDEIRGKQIAFYDTFLNALRSCSSSLRCKSYENIILSNFHGIIGSSFNRMVFIKFIDDLMRCKEICVEDLSNVLPVCQQLDPTLCSGLQQLLATSIQFINEINRTINMPIDGLSLQELESFYGMVNSQLQNEVVERLSHPCVTIARNLRSGLSVKIAELRQLSTQRATIVPTIVKDNISFYKSHLSFVEEAKSTISWLSKIESSSVLVTLPDDITSTLNSILSSIQTKEKANDGNMEDSATPELTEVIKLIQDFLPSVISLGSSQFVKVFVLIVQIILQEVQNAKDESSILMFSAIMTGVFEVMPSSMMIEISKIFNALLIQLSSICIPDFLPSLLSTNTIQISEKSIRLFTFKSALIGRSVYVSSPVTPNVGWTWLVRTLKQFHFIVNKGCGEIFSQRLNDISRCVRILLKFSGFALYVQYQNNFMSILTAITNYISGHNEEETVKLKLFLAKSDAYISPLYFDNQSPFALKAQQLTSHLSVTKGEVLSIDSDKSNPIFETIRQHQIDRLRVIFNKLSATPESQQVAVASLLEKLLIASKCSPLLLRYTLFKISNNIISDSQEEVFNETDEGHPTKLARVACGLCSQIKDLSSAIQSQFYDHCPLTIPRNAREGLTGDEFLTDLRFKRKKNGSWEDQTQWLTRMTKILSTFTVITIQPEQTPFSLLDGWRWFVTMINSSCTSSSPPFFVATAFEVFLRIASPHMLAVYSESFIALLRVIQNQILPKMSEDMPRRQCLQEFLQRFIESNGSDFMTLFQR